LSGARAPVNPLAGATITDGEFQLFQELIYREAGIRLTEAKRDLLVGRLAPRLRELGMTTFSAYYRRVRSVHGDELERMLNRICTNETHFFREPRHFEFLEERLVPQWKAHAEAGKRSRRVQVWSCACSTGEEPYSLAMSLVTNLPASEGWEVRILATDLSTTALDKAARATWPLERAGEIPATYLKEYMLRGTRTQRGRMRACESLRALVHFERFNLASAKYEHKGAFDLIFCRNVLIYFDTASRRRALEQLVTCLAPGGLLFLGHAETAAGNASRLRVVEPTIFASVH
jgi:chemotaxis protein methyltransferase CheR